MKKKLITVGLALSLALGGVSMASASVDGTQAKESQIEYSQISKDETVQPMFWAALGRGVAWGIGWALGEKAASGSSVQADYEYEEIKESFDY